MTGDHSFSTRYAEEGISGRPVPTMAAAQRAERNTAILVWLWLTPIQVWVSLTVFYRRWLRIE